MRLATSAAQARHVAASTTKSHRSPAPETAAATSPASTPATAREALSAE